MGLQYALHLSMLVSVAFGGNIFTPPPPAPAPPAPDTCLCPPSVYPHSGSEYRLFDCPRSWDDAQSECRAWGGDLLQLESELEAQWIEYILDQHYGEKLGFWIGLRRFTCNNNLWYWGDNQLTLFTAWGKQQPDCQFDNEVCAKITDNWSWDDAPCQIPFRYICERPLGAPPPSPAVFAPPPPPPAPQYYYDKAGKKH